MMQYLLFFFNLLNIILSQNSPTVIIAPPQLPYCLFATGCANSSCICPGFLSFCDLSQDVSGMCTATSM